MGEYHQKIPGINDANSSRQATNALVATKSVSICSSVELLSHYFSMSP